MRVLCRARWMPYVIMNHVSRLTAIYIEEDVHYNALQTEIGKVHIVKFLCTAGGRQKDGISPIAIITEKGGWEAGAQ